MSSFMSPAHPTHPAPARAGRHCVGRLGASDARGRAARAASSPARRRRRRASAGLPCVPSGARARAAAAVARDCRLARSPTPESLVSASHSRHLDRSRVPGRSGPSLRHRDRQVTAHTTHKLSNTQGVPPIGRVACSVINLSLSSLTLTLHSHGVNTVSTHTYGSVRHNTTHLRPHTHLTHTSHTGRHSDLGRGAGRCSTVTRERNSACSPTASSSSPLTPLNDSASKYLQWSKTHTTTQA